jgi:hypothetical protein
MSDPIDDALTYLEQHCPDGLQDKVHTLREGWEFVVDHIPDPSVVRTQGHNLSSLHDQGKQLYDEYSQSLLTLREKWQGGLANTYLPPSATAFQIEHDLEPTDSSYSTPLVLYFRDFVDSLDQNGGTHYTWASKFDDMQGKQTTVRVTIGGAVLVGGAVAWIPGVGQGIDIGDIIAAAAIVGGIILTVGSLVALIVIEDLIKARFMPSSAAAPIDWTLPGGAALPKQFDDLANKIYEQFKYLVNSGQLSLAAIAYLACHYSYDFIQQLLDNYALFADVLGPTGLSSTDPDRINGVIPLLHAIFIIGPENIARVNLPFTWRDANGNPIPGGQGGGNKTGDIDIVTNSSPPEYIEVGTYNKSNKKDFIPQLQQLKREAERNGAVARLYIQEPDVPMTFNQASSLQQTIEVALRTLDGHGAVVNVNEATGLVTIDPPSDSVVVMPPLGC